MGRSARRAAIGSRLVKPVLRLAGRAVLVSGASGGIGHAVALACARDGADIALTGRDRDRLAAVAEDVRSLGRRAEALPADARDEPAVERAVETARRSLGPLSGAVLNQGLNRIVPVAGLSTADWREVLDTNLTGSFLFARALARTEPPPERVVFVSSVSGLPGYRKFPGFAAYAASKRGLLGLAEILALEWAPRGTRVYSVCPRGVDTAMFRATFPGDRAELTPDAVAAAIVDLLDPAGAVPSGAVLEL